jgi:hypothetical protein
MSTDALTLDAKRWIADVEIYHVGCSEAVAELLAASTTHYLPIDQRIRGRLADWCPPDRLDDAVRDALRSALSHVRHLTSTAASGIEQALARAKETPCAE